MKSLRVVTGILALLVVFGGASYAKGKDEVTFSGTYVKSDEGRAWTATGEYGIALGSFRVGPAAVLYDAAGVDATLLGVGANFNFGHATVIPYVGVLGLYSLTAETGEEDYSLTYRAGVLVPVGDRGLIRFQASKVGSGVGESTDILGTVGIGLLF